MCFVFTDEHSLIHTVRVEKKIIMTTEKNPTFRSSLVETVLHYPKTSPYIKSYQSKREIIAFCSCWLFRDYTLMTERAVRLSISNKTFNQVKILNVQS